MSMAFLMVFLSLLPNPHIKSSRQLEEAIHTHTYTHTTHNLQHVGRGSHRGHLLCWGIHL